MTLIYKRTPTQKQCMGKIRRPPISDGWRIVWEGVHLGLNQPEGWSTRIARPRRGGEGGRGTGGLEPGAAGVGVGAEAGEEEEEGGEEVGGEGEEVERQGEGRVEEEEAQCPGGKGGTTSRKGEKLTEKGKEREAG